MYNASGSHASNSTNNICRLHSGLVLPYSLSNVSSHDTCSKWSRKGSAAWDICRCVRTYPSWADLNSWCKQIDTWPIIAKTCNVIRTISWSYCKCCTSASWTELASVLSNTILVSISSGRLSKQNIKIAMVNTQLKLSCHFIKQFVHLQPWWCLRWQVPWQLGPKPYFFGYREIGYNRRLLDVMFQSYG